MDIDVKNTTPGQLLKSIRTQAGMTQQEVADKLHLTRAAYAQIELDIISPRQKIKEIAELFNLSADVILGLQPAPDIILTHNERIFIEKFRNLSKSEQMWVKDFFECYFHLKLKDKQ